MLLVMHSMSVFENNPNIYPLGEELFELTWSILDPVYPSLQNDLFPPLTLKASESGEVKQEQVDEISAATGATVGILT